MKNTVATSLVRFAALPVISAGILAGVALGLAGTAGASSAGLGGQEPSGPGNVFTPSTYATPQLPIVGGWNHRHGYTYAPVIIIGGEQG
jgi:hypothetical protein